jgi:hypothetical protein
MSLDVYLEGPHEERKCVCVECGDSHTRTSGETYYSNNITHNLTRMAEAAGIYMALWRPDELGLTKAAQLIEPLRAGLQKLIERPELYQGFDPPNKWGNYQGLVSFVKNYLTACEAHPEAFIRISR